MGRLPPEPPNAASPSVRLRGQIEAALAAGLALEDMTLRVTHRDRVLLSRDPAIAVADISYVGGVMRFLGVRVETSGGAASALDRGRA